MVFAGICGIIAVFIFRRNLSAEFQVFYSLGLFKRWLSGYPQSIKQWMDLYHTKPFLGLIYSNFFDGVNSFLVSSLFFGLCLRFKDTRNRLIFPAFIVSSLGTLTYFITNCSIKLIGLSARYSVLANPTEISDFEEKVSFVLRNANIPGFSTSFSVSHLALFFLLASGVIACFSMKQSGLYKKSSILIGWIANVSGLTSFVFIPFYPQFIFIPISFSAPFIVIWYMIIAVSLLRVHRSV